MFRLIWTNKYFQLPIWLLVKSCKLLAKMKIVQTDYDEFFPRIKWIIAGIKMRKRILQFNLYVEGNDEGQWFAIYIFPHSSRKFQSGLDVFFFQFSVLCSEKLIFWPPKREISSKYRLIMIPSISTMQKCFNVMF